jgi:hypothetical protein
MPVVTHTQRVRAPITVLWAQIQDLSLWAPDIPGYVKHEELSAEESLWTVQGDVGALSRRVEFRVLVTERVEPSRICFSLEGLNESLQGSGSFEAVDTPSGRAPAVPSPRPQSWWRRALHRVVRRRFERTFAAPVAAVGESADDGVTAFVCTLDLHAGGLMGPVVNTLIEPMLAPAAEHLAGNIARAVEARC